MCDALPLTLSPARLTTARAPLNPLQSGRLSRRSRLRRRIGRMIDAPLRALFVRLVSGDAGRERGRAVRRGGQSSETVRRTGVAAAVVVLGGTNGWRSGGESRRRPVLAQWPAQIRSGRDGG